MSRRWDCSNAPGTRGGQRREPGYLIEDEIPRLAVTRHPSRATEKAGNGQALDEVLMRVPVIVLGDRLVGNVELQEHRGRTEQGHGDGRMATVDRGATERLTNKEADGRTSSATWFGLRARGAAKQEGRSDERRDEEPVEGQELEPARSTGGPVRRR